jgi:tetratricopeptide (TPR) repeat protein
VTRRWFASLPFASVLLAQESQKKPQEQEPPEEDESLKPKAEYTFNPLQAENELKIGNFYFKRGSYKAASKRFEEATRWNPTYAEAFLRLGESLEKLRDPKGSKAAYEKYLELAPEAKNADSIRKKINGK